MLLTIIVPFFNSENKCSRLLSTLKNIEDGDVEVIFVDDGSSDGTVSILYEFKRHAKVRVKVFTQENRGPGGARNLGLLESSGKYVWFVDSDDDISLKPIQVLKDKHEIGYDLIDFNLFSNGSCIVNPLRLPAGEYSDKEHVRSLLLDRWSRICTKIISKDFITKNNLLYPENCVYEDLPFVFIFPFYVSSFYKSDVVGYYHHKDFESVTRGVLTSRYFDRMLTCEYGLRRGEALAKESEKYKLYDSFSRLYLFNTVNRLMSSKSVHQMSVAMKVMKMYRGVVHRYQIPNISLKRVNKNWKYNAVFYFLYACSYCIKDQSAYFENVRKKAWVLPFQTPNNY